MKHGAIITVVICIVVLVTSFDAALGAVLLNGDFESPFLPSGTLRTWFYTGETFGGWTVGGYSVDLVLEDWQAASGRQSVDLSGSGIGPIFAGSIFQDISTTPGESYLLTFAMSGNPAGGPPIKGMDVYWGDSLIASLTTDTSGHSPTNMGWEYWSFPLVSLSSSTRLSFVSSVSTAYGPVLDDITLRPIPAPAPLVLGGIGMGLVGWLRRRRAI